ncbi:PspC family transcriptional regulator [Dietzia sp. UCD-THP]|uniref:PspC domain-containing protein n=1 Tax=Dietzia sp. UCD-THP TaxID=1292020 RepID=UPI000370A806|nr:PspC domain-containing protein [Dietzia sp. UCD-THP]EYT63170.1 PspC family transcriptional regulator [Dietzia sp. UCD-THP]
MSSSSTHDVPSELRSLWRTRPVRTPDDAKIAGICGGFGRRYGVDPVLFRIAFVIAALWGGAGVFLYALLWLLLRSAGDEVSKGEALIGRGRASGSKITAVILVVVVLLSAPTFGGSGESLFVGAGFLIAIAMLAGWYGLHRRTPVPPAGWSEVSAVRPQTARADSGRTAGASQEPGSGPGAPYGPPVPPTWDPLGAAPFAWDLPDPGATPPPAPAPPRPRSRLTKVTLGLALIAVAVAGGLATLGGVLWLDATRIAAIGLAVVAGGLLVGAVTRRGHGLLVVAGPLAGFVLLASLVQVPEGGWEGTGEQLIQITDPAQLDAPINHQVGSLTVDMRELELDRDRSYSIANNVGEVQVLLPDGVAVETNCTTDVGSVDCPTGLSGDASGPVLTLSVHSGVGSIMVTR